MIGDEDHCMSSAEIGEERILRLLESPPELYGGDRVQKISTV
jgi:hypothetical protein